MIYVDMTGRCGNQFFQYAFARKLMLLNPSQPLHINFYNVERWRKKLNDDTFSDQLQYFNVLLYSSALTQEDAVTKYGSIKQRKAFKNYQLKRKIANKFKIKSIHKLALHSLNKNSIYREDECKDNILLPAKTDNIFIKGYFEDPKYFDDIRDILLKEFTPIYPRKDKNKELYEIIDARESVCVSFRVWNDISDNAKETKHRAVCDDKYYRAAILKMKELHPDAVFIVFSNDVQWVKDNFEFPGEVHFENGTDEIWEKMRLMYSCKHFIMSTSTFCWWAQYLCRNDKKTVIAPDRWTNGDITPSKLLLDDWIKI